MEEEKKMRANRPRAIKPIVLSRITALFRSRSFFYFLVILPGLYPFYPFLTKDYSVLADPAKYLLEYAGKTATFLFLGVLSLTPLRIIFPRSRIVNALNRHRRRMGVSAFVYILFHLLFYFIYEGGVSSLPENLEKPFILSGVCAFSILLVLAVTSRDAAVRKLGARRWKRLHRMVYAAAILICYHQAAQEKTGVVQTAYFFVPLALLQALRLIKIFSLRKLAG